MHQNDPAIMTKLINALLRILHIMQAVIKIFHFTDAAGGSG